uniref:hypothetical protein n=1 Tax=Paractinoplanes polyasparticus TaxID=2856853 RepID=UPI001C84A668|nr:hypothetical protein [Actinoplanes polyasparticus]
MSKVAAFCMTGDKEFQLPGGHPAEVATLGVFENACTAVEGELAQGEAGALCHLGKAVDDAISVTYAAELIGRLMKQPGGFVKEHGCSFRLASAGLHAAALTLRWASLVSSV